MLVSRRDATIGVLLAATVFASPAQAGLFGGDDDVLDKYTAQTVRLKALWAAG